MEGDRGDHTQGGGNNEGPTRGGAAVLQTLRPLAAWRAFFLPP